MARRAFGAVDCSPRRRSSLPGAGLTEQAARLAKSLDGDRDRLGLLACSGGDASHGSLQLHWDWRGTARHAGAGSVIARQHDREDPASDRGIGGIFRAECEVEIIVVDFEQYGHAIDDHPPEVVFVLGVEPVLLDRLHEAGLSENLTHPVFIGSESCEAGPGYYDPGVAIEAEAASVVELADSVDDKRSVVP
jgi:hypothetical protein